MDLSRGSVDFWGPRCKMVSLVSRKVSENPGDSENPVLQPTGRFEQIFFKSMFFDIRNPFLALIVC